MKDKDSDKSAVSAYLRDVRALVKRSRILTWKDECELSDAIEQGGAAAKRAIDTLVTNNLRYVLKVTAKHAGKHYYEDLIQEGNLGLMKAASKFSKHKKARYITYAGWWISQYVRQYLEDNGRVVRLSPNAMREVRKMNAIIAKIVSDGRPVTDTEIAKLMELPVKKVRALSMWAQEPVSINAPINDTEEGGAEFGDILVDMAHANPDDVIDRDRSESSVHQALAGLEDRERRVIEGRFGLAADVDGELTLEDLAQEFGVSRERIRQIQVAALKKLKKSGANLHLPE